MLLYVLWRRKVNWGLQLGVRGWRLRVACMWLCVLYSPPLFLYCLQTHLYVLANGFRFTAIPLSHECHCLFCIALPLFVFANGFRFTKVPFIFDYMSSNF